MPGQVQSRAASHNGKDMRSFDKKFERWISVALELTSCDLNADAEPLYISQIFQSFREVGVPIICDTRPAEVFAAHLPVRSPGILNLDPIIEPGHSNWCVGRLIGTMEDSVTDELLQRG